LSVGDWRVGGLVAADEHLALRGQGFFDYCGGHEDDFVVIVGRQVLERAEIILNDVALGMLSQVGSCSICCHLFEFIK